MKVTDYVAKRLAKEGVRAVFGMSGGAAVHLFDSFARHPGSRVVATVHEQSAAMAADGYSRTAGHIGVAVTTSGPGATNLLTGVCCSYYDSIPVLMLTGQVATHRLRGDLSVRQVGFQETDVLSIFRPVTKFAEQARRPEDVPRLLEEAIVAATSGRPGPVILDLPDDVQRQSVEVDIDSIEPERRTVTATPSANLEGAVRTLCERLRASARPVMIFGAGVKTPNASEVARRVARQLGIPVVLTWGARDVLTDSDPLNLGTFGVYGPRSGNLIVQDSDLLVCVGTRLSQNQTGAALETFARAAFKCVVDIDKGELEKFERRGLSIDLPIHASASQFLEAVEMCLAEMRPTDSTEWLRIATGWLHRYRDEPRQIMDDDAGGMDANEFIRILSDFLKPNDRIFVDTGGNLTWTCNSIRTKPGQRLESAWNFTPMGYAVAAALGSSFSGADSGLIAIIGDGGMALSLGELATVALHGYPMKIFVFNNGGHGIQKQTLETWLDGRYVAVDRESGLGLVTSWEALASAMDLPFFRLQSVSEAAESLGSILSVAKPMLVEVSISPHMRLHPYLRFGSPLERQLPIRDDYDFIHEMSVASGTSTDDSLSPPQIEGW